MNITAIIPVRFRDYYNENSGMVFHYKKKKLWEHTIESVIRSEKINRVILAYDDDRLVPMLPSEKSDMDFFQRPDFLSLKGVTTLDVVQHVASQYKNRIETDYFMLLEISHPDRPLGLLDNLVKTAEKTPADSHITVKPIKYNYWVQNNEEGSSRIVGGGENTNIAIYQELLGIGSLFSNQSCLSDEPLGNKVNMIPLDGDWVDIDIRKGFYDEDCTK